jgi:hypothetical protein
VKAKGDPQPHEPTGDLAAVEALYAECEALRAETDRLRGRGGAEYVEAHERWEWARREVVEAAGAAGHPRPSWFRYRHLRVTMDDPVG